MKLQSDSYVTVLPGFLPAKPRHNKENCRKQIRTEGICIHAYSFLLAPTAASSMFTNKSNAEIHALTCKFSIGTVDNHRTTYGLTGAYQKILGKCKLLLGLIRLHTKTNYSIEFVMCL